MALYEIIKKISYVKNQQLHRILKNLRKSRISWKHQKLRNFIKTDKALNSLVGKKIEYIFPDDINSNYAYCIVEI